MLSDTFAQIVQDPTFLAREARAIAVTRALRALPLADLEATRDAEHARAAAYTAAGVAPVTDAEDSEAVRRQRVYFRVRKPAATAAAVA